MQAMFDAYDRRSSAAFFSSMIPLLTPSPKRPKVYSEPICQFTWLACAWCAHPSLAKRMPMLCMVVLIWQAAPLFQIKHSKLSFSTNPPPQKKTSTRPTIPPLPDASRRSYAGVASTVPHPGYSGRSNRYSLLTCWHPCWTGGAR